MDYLGLSFLETYFRLHSIPKVSEDGKSVEPLYNIIEQHKLQQQELEKGIKEFSKNNNYTGYVVTIGVGILFLLFILRLRK